MSKEYKEYNNGELEVKNTDRVNHPSYYNNGPYLIADIDYYKGDKIPIECIDVIRDMPTWKGNAIKYLWREGDKTEEGLSPLDKEIEDINKAIWYLNNKVEQLIQLKNGSN